MEIGAGNGLNFAHYPPAVTSVIAVEPDDVLVTARSTWHTKRPYPSRACPGHVDALPAGGASIDVVVASLVLRSVPDQASAGSASGWATVG